MKALKVGVLSIGVYFAFASVSGAHTSNMANDAGLARAELAKRLAAAAENVKNATLCMERARKAAELGAQEVAVEEITCVLKLSVETDRLAADGRLISHATHVYDGSDANAPVGPGFEAAATVRGLAFEAAALQTKCCDVAFKDKIAHDLMKADFEKQNATIKKGIDDASKALAELAKAAAGWEDVDAASRKKLALVTAEILPAIKTSTGLFEKFTRLALNAIDYTVDGSDEHYNTLTKEGTTARKVVEILNAEAGGAEAKFTEDLDELGVPTMNKSFKIAKANFESVARVGERIINGALAVLRPSVRARIKEKALGNLKKIITAAKERLVAVVAEVKAIQEKLGSGGGGDSSVASE